MRINKREYIELCKLSIVALLILCSVCISKSEKSWPCVSFLSEETTINNTYKRQCLNDDFLQEKCQARFVCRLEVKISNFSRVISLIVICVYKTNFNTTTSKNATYRRKANKSRYWNQSVLFLMWLFEKINLKLLMEYLTSKYYFIGLLAELYSISKTSHFQKENWRNKPVTHLDKENVLRENSERGAKFRAWCGLIWRQKVRKMLGAILRVMSENPAADIWNNTRFTSSHNKQQT